MKSNTLTYFAILLLFTISTSFGQDRTKADSTKKKSAFWQTMKGVGAVAGNILLQREVFPVTPLNSATSRQTAGNTGSSLISGNTIRGEWKELGPGGKYSSADSPRNHHYTFSITQDNATLSHFIESTCEAQYFIFTETGKRVAQNHTTYNASEKDLRAGNYYMVVTADRAKTGRYMITLDGPVRNVVKQQFAHWQQDKVSFGNEGGGGAYDNFFSPRNHVYTFEPELDSWFDVQAESNGVPIKICVVDPTGKVMNQDYSGNDGVGFLVSRATQKGVYKIWVASSQTNGRGAYKLDVVGTLKQNPTRIEATQQTINGRFAASQKRHEYRIPARLGNIEIIYRSTNTPASFTLYDQFNQPISEFFESDYKSYNQLLDRSFAVKQEGTLKLVVETKEATVGDYELMVWGHAGPIVNANQRAATPAPAPATTAPASTGKAAQILADVLLSGRIRLPRSASSFRGVKVVYEDVDTGQKLGEALPDDKGNYSIMVPPGRKYAITATTEDGAISSSQYVNLARKTQPNERIVLDEIAIISASDVGSAIALNNIFFETGKDRLLPASYTELSRVAKFMKANPSVKVEISGHTDMQGSATLNQKLSQDRAISVSYYLQGNGIGAGQIKAIGLGSSKPVAPNTTPAGREKNRRVEFKIVGKS